MPLLEGKVAHVTGGGSGIGQATCHFYAREATKPNITFRKTDIGVDANLTADVSIKGCC